MCFSYKKMLVTVTMLTLVALALPLFVWVFTAHSEEGVIGVEVQTILVDGEEVPNMTLIVELGRELEFEAIPNSTSGFQGNDPIWSGTNDDGANKGKTKVDVTFNEPGCKIVAAKAGGGHGLGVSVTTVGVEKLIAKLPGAVNPSAISLTDDPGENETLYVPVGSGTVTITAVPDPDGSWPEGDFPTWTGGGEEGTGSKGTFNLETSKVESYTITVSCGPSQKAINVVVFKIDATHMAFNHSPDSNTGNSALNLRESYSGAAISAPEVIGNSGDKPVLYIACNNPQSQPHIIKACFEIRPAVAAKGIKVSAGVTGWQAISTLNEKSVDFEVEYVFVYGYLKAISTSVGDDVNGVNGFVSFNVSGNGSSCINKELANFQWKVSGCHGQDLPFAVNMNRIENVTIYTILGTPFSPWTQEPGARNLPWVTALDFVIETCDIKNVYSENLVLGLMTIKIHSLPNREYETVRGATRFMASRYPYKFNMTKFISGIKSKVNCHDQAAAVTHLGNLLGIAVEWKRKEPFGYLSDTSLVGVPGMCNNPLFNSTRYYPAPLVDLNHSKRSGFDNHGFSECINKVYDACAGPSIGTETITSYVERTIDHKTDLYQTNPRIKEGVDDSRTTVYRDIE